MPIVFIQPNEMPISADGMVEYQQCNTIQPNTVHCSMESTTGECFKNILCVQYSGGMVKDIYTPTLQFAKDKALNSIVMPILVQDGTCSFKNIINAMDCIKTFLVHTDLIVYLQFDKRRLVDNFLDIQKYVNLQLEESNLFSTRQKKIENNYDNIPKEGLPQFEKRHRLLKSMPFTTEMDACTVPFTKSICAFTLETELQNLDESFTQMLFRLIDERGITDSACYKKANVDRKVFSKMRGRVNYKPSKTTAVAFAFALELSLPEAKRLVELAGYSLTRNNKFDIIVRYFLEQKKYDIFEVNQVLFAFDQKILGCVC